MTENRFDLHIHSIISDGTVQPSELVTTAAGSNLKLIALTDHDSILGVKEAVETGRKVGLPVLPAVEMDNEWRHELHIIGLDVDPDNPTLVRALEIARDRRERRNKIIYRNLKEAGYDVQPLVQRPESMTTKLHIAHALIKAGYAVDVRDAFSKYLRPGRPGYYTEPRFTPQQVIDIIHIADGLPILAHPCHIRDNPHGLIRELYDMGLMGLEAYYPSSTPRQTEMYVSIARQYQMLVTCGSDFHGDNRPGVLIGCAWRNVPVLEKTYETLVRRMNS
jgi:predicted metal-dependent phosphoesterase TrpH